jgi:hypothetical protein
MCHSNYWKVREKIKDLYIMEKRSPNFIIYWEKKVIILNDKHFDNKSNK